MHVCVRAERRCLNKIFTEHWQHPCCQVTSCNPLHDDALPWCQRTDRCGPHTSDNAIHPGGKILIRSNFENGISGIFQNDPGEIHAVTFGDVVPQKESSCITEDSKSQVMEEPEMFFGVRTSSGGFPQHNSASICFNGF